MTGTSKLLHLISLGLVHPEVSRLLAHAGADATEMAYIPAATKWLEILLRLGWEYVTVDDLDRLMMKEVDTMCYGESKKRGRGSLLGR